MNEAALYNKIGVEYDETRRADEFLTGHFRFFLAPSSAGNYIDVGCGTGNYTCALASGDYQFYGIDPSDLMLEKARRRHCGVIWKTGEAENLPFEDEYFDGAIASLTIHHWKSLNRGFGEISRVLKPNGRFVLFTSFPEQMENYWLNHFFPQMLRDSIKQMPEFSKIEEALKTAELKIEKTENYFVRKDLQDHFLYCGKNRPELYLRDDIRRGISSFSSLANKKEIELGLAKLIESVNNETINEIIEKYKSDKGDYVFIVAAKN